MLAEDYTVSRPYACDDLNIFLIHGADELPEAHFLSWAPIFNSRARLIGVGYAPQTHPSPALSHRGFSISAPCTVKRSPGYKCAYKRPMEPAKD